jgi:hypothetical protein
MFNKQQLQYILMAVQRVQEDNTNALRFKSHLQFQLCDELDKIAQAEEAAEAEPMKAVEGGKK